MGINGGDKSKDGADKTPLLRGTSPAASSPTAVLGHDRKTTDDDGSGGGTDCDYPTAAGYHLTPDGLAAVVSQRQLGAVDAFGGAAGLAAAIGCPDVRRGLSSTSEPKQQRLMSLQRKRYGSNASSPPSVPSLLSLYREGLKDPTVLMLLCSSAVSLILGLGIEQDFQHGWIEGTSISVTVLLVVSVAALTDYAKARAFSDQLVQLESKKQVHVIRNGGTMEQIHPRDLVVGDVLLLAVGDICPVDGILLEGSSSDMKIDESALTGETDLIEKSPYIIGGKSSSDSPVDPFIISGTNVMLGTGRMLVLAVGSNSIQGKILARIRERDDDDDDHRNDDDKNSNNREKHEEDEQQQTRHGPWTAAKKFFTLESLAGSASTEGADLMGKLDVLAMDIGKVGLIVAAVVFVVLIVSWAHGQVILGRQCPGLSGAGEEACVRNLRCRWVSSVTGDGQLPCQKKHVSAGDLSVVLDFFITGVTILVVAVPEGLPLAVTLALAVSIRRMMTDNNQVKHMDSCETMGSATTICSDKTGTLTENRMTATRLRVADRDYEHAVGKKGSSFENLGRVILGSSGQKSKLTDLVAESILLNCAPTSKVVFESSDRRPQRVRYEGNATECALIKLSMQLGYDPDKVRRSFREEGGSIEWGVFACPFSSQGKRMSWIVRQHDGGKPFRMYSKGAPQQLFDICTSYVAGAGSSSPSGDNDVTVRSLGPTEQAVFEEKVNEYQRAGLRSLGIAYKDLDAEPSAGWEKVSFEGLTLLGVVGIEDPLRPSVPGAIADCRKAGIDVRMCTGDALTTGIAIAKGCGILRPTDLNAAGDPKVNFAMTGAEFDDRVHRKDPSKPKAVRRVFDPKINDAVDRLAEPFLLDASGNKVIDQSAFDEIWPTLRVLARCQPEDKLTLVRGMRKSKVFMDETRCAALQREHGIRVFPDFQVVAVTGDGTNDAPALKSANVGFAMGIVGTETSKQACDIILLDDNFSSIVKAALWGRNVFDSISKFLQFQLTVNIVAITLATVGAFAYAESPLTAVQMLWINMIMDSLASLALATELPTKELLERAPYGRRRPIISRVMATNILGHSVYQIAVMFWVLFAPGTLPGVSIDYEPHQGSHHWSVFFNVFVMLQLFNEFNSRKLVTVAKLRTTWREWNVFHGVFSNSIFVAIMLSTFAVQVLIVQMGGQAINLIPGGLGRNEWILCVVMGACGLIWQAVLNATMAFLCSVPGSEDEVEKRSEESANEEIAKLDAEMIGKEWEGMRRGFTYAKMFRTNFETGYKLHTLIKKAVKEKKQERAISKRVQSIVKRLAHQQKKDKKEL